MNTLYNESEYVASENRKWERGNTAELVFDFESKGENVSQRDFAKKTALPGQHCGIGLKEKKTLMHIQLS